MSLSSACMARVLPRSQAASEASPPGCRVAARPHHEARQQGHAAEPAEGGHGTVGRRRRRSEPSWFRGRKGKKAGAVDGSPRPPLRCLAPVTALDWIIVAFTLLMAVWGYAQGLIVGALSLAGFAGARSSAAPRAAAPRGGLARPTRR